MFYEIKTDRLLMRPLCIDDLETVYVYAADEENTTYMFWLPNHKVEETVQFLIQVTNEWKKEEPSFYEFAIVLDGLQIGAISIYLDDTRKIGELGWIINKRYWKKGIATEAALAIKDFAIHTLKVRKLTANCDYRNIASYSLMNKIGLRLEDDKKVRTYTKNNETVKELTYSLVIDHKMNSVEFRG